MKTKNGIFLNISESDITLDILDVLTLFFSSKRNLKKFVEKVDGFSRLQNLKYKARYGLNINNFVLDALLFYTEIEKRGFCVQIGDEKICQKNQIWVLNGKVLILQD